MGNDEQKRYRLKGIYATAETQSGHQTTRLQYDVGKTVGVGDELALSDDQAERVRRFGELEEVKGSEPSLDLVDQTGIVAVSSSTAEEPVTGSTPDVDSLSSSDLKALARQEDIDGRSGMSEAQLRKALKDHYSAKEA